MKLTTRICVGLLSTVLGAGIYAYAQESKPEEGKPAPHPQSHPEARAPEPHPQAAPPHQEARPTPAGRPAPNTSHEERPAAPPPHAARPSQQAAAPHPAPNAHPNTSREERPPAPPAQAHPQPTQQAHQPPPPRPEAHPQPENRHVAPQPAATARPQPAPRPQPQAAPSNTAYRRPAPPTAAQQHDWDEHRVANWQAEHRTWEQRGGYHGYRVPDDRYREYFGRPHSFVIYSNPVVFSGGYPRFQYGGYWVQMVDPWPSNWASNWFYTDRVYLDYWNGGYYLFDSRYPGVPIAVEIFPG